MTAIRAIFLDLGNVLAFHDDDVLFRRMSAWGGAEVDTIRAQMLTLWDPINSGSLAGDELRRTICRIAGSEIPLDPERFYDMWTCHFRVHEAVQPMVESLLAQLKVVLVSNVNKAHWRRVRDLLPILDRFHGLVLSYELAHAKPAPELFQAAIDLAKVQPREAAYFDDVPRFVDGARNFGLHGRVFTDAPTFRTQLAELGIVV